jgi:hypothetical protein
MKVLVKLHPGYGMGDAVQMSSVLQHLAKYKRSWIIFYRAEGQFHTVGYGIAHKILNAPSPMDIDSEVEICLYDTWANWHDRPNTRVSSCLHDTFGLGWDPECAKYKVNVTQEQTLDALEFLDSIGADLNRQRSNVIAIHYRGDSDKVNKDLSHEQATQICNHILWLDYIPLLLDWRSEWPTSILSGVKTVGKNKTWGRDPQRNCALIALCTAFVGIDSGPSKCAGATDTPSLVTWTGHHPAPFFDPASNVTHNVPDNYHGLFPVCNDPGVIDWFEQHHKVQKYDNPVTGINTWLSGIVT